MYCWYHLKHPETNGSCADFQEIPAAPSTATTFKPCRNIISASIPSEAPKSKVTCPVTFGGPGGATKGLEGSNGPTKNEKIKVGFCIG